MILCDRDGTGTRKC